MGIVKEIVGSKLLLQEELAKMKYLVLVFALLLVHAVVRQDAAPCQDEKIIHNVKRDCFFYSECQTNEECLPCGYICALVIGYGLRCMTDPNQGPVNDV